MRAANTPVFQLLGGVAIWGAFRPAGARRFTNRVK